jgi:hypothetical protein
MTLSRRALLVAGGFGVGIAASAGFAATDYDPRRSAEGQMKMLATLDGSPAFWHYTNLIYAMLPGQHPRPILAASGCQSSWAERMEDGSYRVTGTTMTMFRDLETGAILESFENPFTGRRNIVQTNFLSGGGLRYPADGSSASLEIRPASGGVIAPKGYGEGNLQRKLGLVRWKMFGESIQLTTDHSWPVPVQPQLEAQTVSASKAEFFDPRVLRMSARDAGVSIMPWMTWMEMGDVAGHLMWHYNGEKLFSLDSLDADYRAHAGDRLEKLARRP